MFYSIVPESARWLYSQGKSGKADYLMHKMAKFNGVTLPDKLEITVQVRQTLCILHIY